MKRILKNHRLRKVIKLPEDLFFGVGITTSIFVFEAGVGQKGKEFFACYMESDGLATVKNKGRHDIYGKWAAIEAHWVEVMEKHMDDAEFTTDEFAREMCMSRSNLHLKMKALTGESTNEFIRKMRFNYACKLLKEGKYTVSEISSMVGYVPSYFATSFKKYFGCLPSEYGKNGKSNHSQT